MVLISYHVRKMPKHPWCEVTLYPPLIERDVSSVLAANDTCIKHGSLLKIYGIFVVFFSLKRLMDLDDSVINSLKDDSYDISCVCSSSMVQGFPKGNVQFIYRVH